MPKKLKHYDLRKVFPNPTKANINLKSMKETIEEENFVLILIETLNNHVFGVFLFEKLKHPEEKQPFNKNKSMISNSVEDDEGKLDRKK